MTRVEPRSAESVHDFFQLLVNEGDLNGVLSLYEKRGVLVNRDGATLTGEEAIRMFLQSMLAYRPQLRIDPVTKIEAGDIAVLIADWQLSGKTPDENTVRDGGRTYDVVRRQADGSWRYVVDSPWGSRG